MIYDIRYNILSANYKHFARAPINSIAAFNPSKSFTSLNLSKSDASSPLALISAGSLNYELSLLNLETCSLEVLLTVDDRKDRDQIVAGLPPVPSFLREGLYTYSDII